ncbi:PREDICTED: SEC23-interacting protein-like [Rhagoletis zephyria]|uniref:SEC23-interacting protein-like n=1 Tax=Rhagoletis zephyria TaxID=28612 RepID=UPI00081123B8|nr:PREDICTED: SEC23-interacting protein-like [Rhagoletis zephyria]
MSENVQHCLNNFTVYQNFFLFLFISVEPKPLVTIGSSTDLDTESLDEINLNTNSDETQSATDTAGLNDPNANQLWSETNNQPSDSILTQAASSFSALPSVASSVLSTFSKRISEYSGSNSRERTPTSDNGTLASQLDIQPTYLQQQFPSPPQQQQQQPSVQKQYPYYSNLQVNAPPTVGAAQPTGNPVLEASESHAASPPEPPKFYTPTEFTNLPTANVPPPPIPGGQNTYRLAAKKKLYAPIPGLSEQPAAPVAPTIDPLSSTAPFQGVPPLPTQTTSVTDPFGFPTQSLKQEERKTGGLFANISNLVPSGVLQNISGLVQTAADTFTQGSNKQFTEEHSQQPYYGYSGAYQQLPLEVASAPAGQYFATSIVPPLPFAPQSHSALLEGNPSASELFAPIQLPPSQQSVSQGQAPTTQQTSNLFEQRPTPSLSQPAPPPPTSGFVAAPPKSVPPESSKQRPSASTTPIAYFDPTKQTSSLGPLFAGAEQQEVNAAPLAATGKPFTPAVLSPQENYPTTATAPCPLNEPQIQTKLLTPAEVVQQPFSTGLPFINQKGFGASNAAHLPLIPETSSKDATCPPQSTSTFLPPPTQQIVVGNQAPLPPTTGGSTSFRLQKGTRLYKSPLTTAETAPVHVQPDIVQSLVPPTSLFNPFGSSVAASVPHPLAPSATPTLVPSYFIAQPSPYSPAVKHWFYKRPTGSNKFVWTPFSHYDSALLETTLSMGANSPNIVAVEGGRYDVNIKERTKTAVYWECAPIEVRRCSWFYKGTDSKMVPYEESIADLLESEYKQAFDSGEWHKKIVLSMHEQVTFHGPTVIVHFQQQQSTDAWGGTSQTTTRPRVVKRDLDEFTIEQGESERVDHLLLMVHGIGSACDLKMRSVDEVVDDFRNIAQALVQSHYKNSTEMGLVGRVEVLPISWHSHLHSEEMGIDEKLRSITLESIPKLRNFTNDTLLDVLFYTSPKYCQKIMNTVAASMNEVYNKYRERHPEFNGGVSVAGHSLGSLILFDLLCHQKAPKETEEQNLENPDQLGTSPMDVSNDDLSVTSYTMGHAGTGQPFIHYPQLNFEPKKVFALGSPIGMFVTIRGIDKLGLDFRLPTCSGFYNIFHPFDPVAYRIEALVNPDLSNVRPVLIPHHKGRKRMHLELKETMTRVGADLKQRFLDTFKNTLESVNFLGGSTRTSRDAEENMSKEVDKVLSMQIEAEKQQKQAAVQPSLSSEPDAGSTQANTEPPRTRSDSVSTSQSDSDLVEIDFPLGKLNDSKRIDYVLQEAPLEFINEYIFAMGAHVCYWESEDTILFVMKEIYTGLGISPDSQVPQQTMTIERPSSQNSNTLSPINEKR